MLCTTENGPTSTLVQLLYASPPALGFPSLLGHLCQTLGTRLGQSARLATVGDGTAHLDMAEHRLTIALHRDLPGAVDTCISLGIGPRPDARPDDLNPAQRIAEQTDLARKVSEAVTRRLPADQMIWHIAPGLLTQAMIEDLIGDLPRTLPKPTEAGDDTVDLSRVMEQVQLTLSDTSKSSTKTAVPKPDALPGFSGRWPATGQMVGGDGAARRQRRSSSVPVQPMPAIAPPANDIPALPRLDQKAILRAHSALHHGKTRPATRLILSAGQTSERVVAFLSHAC